MEKEFLIAAAVATENAMSAYWPRFFENLAEAIREKVNPDLLEVVLFKDKDGITLGDKKRPGKSALNLYACTKNRITLLWESKDDATFFSKSDAYGFYGLTIGMNVIANFDLTNPLPSREQIARIQALVEEKIGPFLKRPLPRATHLVVSELIN